MYHQSFFRQHPQASAETPVTQSDLGKVKALATKTRYQGDPKVEFLTGLRVKLERWVEQYKLDIPQDAKEEIQHIIGRINFEIKPRV